MRSSYTPESALLRPVDPSLNSDDWPVFELTSCDIFVPDGDGRSPFEPDAARGLVSLLEADVRNPLLVRGKLNSIPRDHSHLRLRPSAGTESLQLENVRQFAYGQYEDGRVDLWAAGSAAWYTIRPSRAYRAIYERMVEAVEILYYCADAHGGQSTKSRKGRTRDGMTADNVMGRYAIASVITQDEAEARFNKHAKFLLASMMSGKENIDWAKTDLWTWMTQNNQELFQALKATKKRPAEPASKAGIKRKRSAASGAGRAVRSMSSQNASASAPSRPKLASRRSLVEPETPRTSTPVDTSDTDSTSSEKPPRPRKGKSTLRPRTTKYIPIETVDSTDGDESASKGPSRPSSKARGHVSPLAVPMRPAIPRHSRRDNSSNTTDATSGSDLVDEGIDMSLDQSQDSGSDTNPEILSHPTRSVGQPMAVRLREEHMATAGDGDVWTCPLDGCADRVYASSEPESQKLIKEHFRRHGNDDDSEMRLELVRTMQAPGLPVDRLMSRIQAFAGHKGFPLPIAQRY